MISSLKPRGFTPIEVLLVIAILAILAGIVIIAINPSKQLGDTRNAERWSDVYAILNAVHQYAVDHESTYPGALSTEELEICRTDSESCDDMYELTELTDEGIYLIGMPVDPLCDTEGWEEFSCGEGGTGYFITVTDVGRVTVTAPNAEEEEIYVTQ